MIGRAKEGTTLYVSLGRGLIYPCRYRAGQEEFPFSGAIHIVYIYYSYESLLISNSLMRSIELQFR